MMEKFHFFDHEIEKNKNIINYLVDYGANLSVVKNDKKSKKYNSVFSDNETSLSDDESSNISNIKDKATKICLKINYQWKTTQYKSSYYCSYYKKTIF